MKRTLALILATIMLFAGCILPAQAEDFIFESEHPYPAGYFTLYVYEYENENDGFFVTFDESTSILSDRWITPPQPDWTIEDMYENYLPGDSIAVYQNYSELSFAHVYDDEEAFEDFYNLHYLNGVYDSIDYGRKVFYSYDYVDYYTGTELAGKTIYVKGDNLAIEINSRNEQTSDFGFAVDYIGTTIPEGLSYVHYNLGEESYYDFFHNEEGVFVNSKHIEITDDMSTHKITGWATEPGGEKVYDGVGYIEDGETATNFIPYSENAIELYPVMEKFAYSVTYMISNKLNIEDCFTASEDMYVANRYSYYFDPVLFKGWSEQKDATEAEYLPGDLLEETRDYVLYPVLIPLSTPLIDLDECWSFGNYTGEPMDADAKYEMMIRNAVKTWAINPALWVPAAIYTTYISNEYDEPSGGYCFGMALTVILNHFGYIDLLEGREEACVADLTHDEYTDSIIHYYHTIQTQGVLCDQFALENNTDLYRLQVKNMCESLKSGNVVQISPSWNNLNFTDIKENTIDFGGHSMVLAAITDIEPVHLYPFVNNEENENLYKDGVVCDKIITVYDSNYPGRYQYIYVAEDYSYMIYESYVYGAFRWGDDFSHFKSFDHNGDSDHLSWHIAFIKNIIRIFKTVFELILGKFAV